MLARDVMATQVVTVLPDTGVREVARMLFINRISAVPVVDTGDRILGMLSEGDLMRRSETGTNEHHSWWLPLVADLRIEALVKSHGLHARDMMVREIVSISEDASIGELGTRLECHRIKRVLVVRDGKLIGIVSRANLPHDLVARQETAATSGSKRAIRAAIIDALIKVEIPRHFLNAVVSNRVVYLWDPAQSESERDAVRIAAEATPSVKRIENLFSYYPHGFAVH